MPIHWSHTPNYLLKQACSPFLTCGSSVMLHLGTWSSLHNLPLFKSLCLIFTDFFCFMPSLYALSTKLLQHFKPFLNEQMSREGREGSLGRHLKGVPGFHGHEVSTGLFRRPASAKPQGRDGEVMPRNCHRGMRDSVPCLKACGSKPWKCLLFNFSS